MNKEEFVDGIKKHIVKYNHDSLRKNLTAPIPDRATNVDYVNMIKFYQELKESDKQVVDNFLKMVIDNVASSFLSVLDGVSDIGQEGEFELNYIEHGKSHQLNEDKGKHLIDYFWDTD